MTVQEEHPSYLKDEDVNLHRAELMGDKDERRLMSSPKKKINMGENRGTC